MLRISVFIIIYLSATQLFPQNGLLQPPNLIYPPENAVGIRGVIPFKWNSSMNAIQYDVQISRDSTFEIKNKISFITDLSDTVTQVILINGGGRWYWRARARTSLDTSNWSSIWNFKMVPDPPDIITPTSQTMGYASNLTFVWHPSFDASSYHLQVVKAIGNNTIIDITGITDTSYTVNGLADKTIYRCQISGVNDSEGYYSSTTFAVGEIPLIPNTPNLVYPRNGDVNIPQIPTYTWNSTLGSTIYLIQISYDSSFTNNLANVGIYDTSYTLPYLLGQNSTVFWRVSAQGFGGQANWSETSKFTTIGPSSEAPLLDSPYNGADNITTNPIIVWHSLIGETFYELQIATDTGFSNLAMDVGLFDTTYHMGGLNYNTTYYWKVRTIKGGPSGISNSFSEVWNFKTIREPIIAPSNLSVTEYDTIVTVIWNDNSNNESGFIIQRHDGDSTTINLYQTIDTAVANSSTFKDSSIVKGSTYTYRVYAFDADTVSDFSNLAEVTIPLPVEMTYFTAASNESSVNLIWSTSTELNNKGFEIERKTTGTWERIGFIDGNGNSTKTIKYYFTDDLSKSNYSGKVEYRIKQIDYDGAFIYSKVIEITVDFTVKEYALAQNYPNPFNPTTDIHYEIPNDGLVTLNIFDELGREIKTLVNQYQSKGRYDINFDASKLTSGIYFYQLQAGNFISTKKMLLLK